MGADWMGQRCERVTRGEEDDSTASEKGETTRQIRWVRARGPLTCDLACGRRVVRCFGKEEVTGPATTTTRRLDDRPAVYTISDGAREGRKRSQRTAGTGRCVQKRGNCTVQYYVL